MRVLYFGTYERDYPRNAQVISCLRRAGVEVVERHATLWEQRPHKYSLGLGAMARVAVKETRLLFGRKGAFDVMIVGYPGHFDMPAARRIAGGRPLVFNPLVSLWDTLVGDRERFAPRSRAAGVLRQIDRLAFRRADLVVADTEQNARYFAERFSLPRERTAVCLVGAEDDVFRPGWHPPRTSRCSSSASSSPCMDWRRFSRPRACCQKFRFASWARVSSTGCSATGRQT